MMQHSAVFRPKGIFVMCTQAVGKGAYGTVCSARERATGERVAIKKIANCFDHIVDARSASLLYQLRLLTANSQSGAVSQKYGSMRSTIYCKKDVAEWQRYLCAAGGHYESACCCDTCSTRM